MAIQALINRDSGTVRSMGADTVRDQVSDALGKSDRPVVIDLVAGKDFDQRLAEAIAARPDALIVAGGDGTVSSTAARLAGSGIPLGILPLGTMNLFARTIGMPLDLAAAAAALADAEPRKADIAEANGHAFVHQLSLGLQPRMVRLREKNKTYGSRAGKILASVRALATTLRRPIPLPLVISLDGDERRVETPGLVVSNNPYGPGHLPYADRPATGLLGIYSVASDRFVDLVALAAEVFLGSWQEDENVTMDTAREVVVASGASGPRRLTASIDGELVPLELPIRIEKRPGALTVLVPRTERLATTGDRSGPQAPAPQPGPR